MSSLLHEYRNWVRSDPQSAQQLEQISRLAVFLLAAPTSLLSMEMSHSFVNVLGDINQSVIREEEEHTNFNLNNPAAQQVQQKINTYASVVRIIRELQNCGELVVRKFATQYLQPRRHSLVSTDGGAVSAVVGRGLFSAPVIVQLYVGAVEITKLFFRMKQNEDIWKIVLPQLFSFQDVSSGRGYRNSSNNSFDANNIVGDDSSSSPFFAARNGGNQGTTVLKVPHIISASSSSNDDNNNNNNNQQKLNLSRPDRIGLWLDLIDLIRPVIMSVALVSGSIWHKRRSLHKAWSIWLIGLAYEVIAYIIQNYYLKQRRTAFLRESTGQLVLQLHDRSREQLIGFHLMKYPFFNLIAEPELRRRILARDSWVGKIPLIGGILQGLVEYQVQLQKQCVLYSSGS